MKHSLNVLHLLIGVLSLSAQDNQWAPTHQGTPLLNLDYIVDFNPERGVPSPVPLESAPAWPPLLIEVAPPQAEPLMLFSLALRHVLAESALLARV